MSNNCLDIISKLNLAIDHANDQLIMGMVDKSMSYNLVCVKRDVTYQTYYKNLKFMWDKIITEFINSDNKCNKFNNFVKYLDIVADPKKIQNIKKIYQKTNNLLNADSNMGNLFDLDLENIVFDRMADYIINKNDARNNLEFSMNENFMLTMRELTIILLKECRCNFVNIFKLFVDKYKTKYQSKYRGLNKNQTIDLLRKDYDKFKKYAYNFSQFGEIPHSFIPDGDFIELIAKRLASIFSFTVESELDRLIPNELGSLKEFFITVVKRYYENLHPIIWAQIFKSATENLFIDLPLSVDEIFAFASKQLLLNSGPFILKMLQMIRPVLTPELAAKYNLTKLTYPLMSDYQVNNILSTVTYDWPLYEIMANYSASVGHVVKVIRVDYPDKPFIIKIIKPLAIAQSCWEYKTLYDIYPDNSCEKTFIKNILESNGRELNVFNEINNIQKGHEYYTTNYEESYGYNINANLTTIENIPEILDPNCWIALTMTLAPGIPLSKLVENDLVSSDTIYRAKLHRCLDLLVYKFFYNIVKNGFYHGDLHAGNIFFSFEQDQMTLIDFGAVSEIDIFSNDPDVLVLMDIIIMSIFYNYEDMFDMMTILLNSKCVETQINPYSPDYINLKKKFSQYRVKNIKNMKREKELAKRYEEEIFSEQRIQAENNYPKTEELIKQFHATTIYSYLEHEPSGTEPIIENKDIIPVSTDIQESGSVSFTDVLEEIIKYYALSGVNIAIKFNDMYELQKAYALLLGVLFKVGYNSYRTNIAIKKVVTSWTLIPKLFNIKTVKHFVESYKEQKEIFKEVKRNI